MNMPRGKHRQKETSTLGNKAKHHCQRKETSAPGNKSKRSPVMQSSNTNEMIRLESNEIILGSKQMALELVKCVSVKEEER